MNESYEIERDEFMEESAWSPTGEGWKRTPMKGMVVEIVKLGNRYQPIIDPDGISRVFRRDCPVRPWQSLKEAKEFAWTFLKPLLEALSSEDDRHEVTMG